MGGGGEVEEKSGQGREKVRGKRKDEEGVNRKGREE